MLRDFENAARIDSFSSSQNQMKQTEERYKLQGKSKSNRGFPFLLPLSSLVFSLAPFTLPLEPDFCPLDLES